MPRNEEFESLSHIFTWVEENFGFWWSQMSHNEEFKQLFSEYLHQGWRKFWILMSSNSQNDEFELFLSGYLHQGWRKFWILMISNSQNEEIEPFLSGYFQQVEENSGFWWSSKMLKNIFMVEIMVKNQGFEYLTHIKLICAPPPPSSFYLFWFPAQPPEIISHFPGKSDVIKWRWSGGFWQQHS